MMVDQVADSRCPRTEVGGIPKEWNEIAQVRDPIRNWYWMFSIIFATDCNTGLHRSDEKCQREQKAYNQCYTRDIEQSLLEESRKFVQCIKWSTPLLSHPLAKPHTARRLEANVPDKAEQPMSDEW